MTEYRKKPNIRHINTPLRPIGVPLNISYDVCPKICHVIQPLWRHECH